MQEVAGSAGNRPVTTDEDDRVMTHQARLHLPRILPPNHPCCVRIVARATLDRSLGIEIGAEHTQAGPVPIRLLHRKGPRIPLSDGAPSEAMVVMEPPSEVQRPVKENGAIRARLPSIPFGPVALEASNARVTNAGRLGR